VETRYQEEAREREKLARCLADFKFAKLSRV